MYKRQVKEIWKGFWGSDEKLAYLVSKCLQVKKRAPKIVKKKLSVLSYRYYTAYLLRHKVDDKTILIESKHGEDPVSYTHLGVMMVKMGDADGMVSGACHSTADTLRPSLQILKTKPGTKLVSAFFLMEVPNCEYGENGTFVFGDCGLNQNPTSEELAAIDVYKRQEGESVWKNQI